MQAEGLELTEEAGQVFLRGTPVPNRTGIGAEQLHALLEQHGFGGWHVDEEALAAAVEQCTRNDTPFVLPVAQRQDGRIEVEVSSDAMVATVSLAPPKGGKPASIEDVIRALVDAGVTVGVDHDALLQACQASSAERVVAAQGYAPLEGRDSDFQELVAESSNRAPKVNDDGLIDYREHNALLVVEPGAPLLRRVPAVPGTDGQTVLGQRLEPRAVRDEPFAESLSGAQISADDPEVLTASIAGTPVRVPGGMVVEPVLRVKEVNLASGNIYFDGTVYVEGDVNQGMKVQATGDIFVGGTVEAGKLEAQGNITVKGGVIADSQLQAVGSVSVRFAEASRIHAGTVLTLDDSAIECQLEALNQMVIGTRNTQRGRLMGGTATAKLLLQVPVLGSVKSKSTRVIVGYDPQLEAAYQVLQERIAKEKENEDNLQKLVRHLTAIKDPKGMLERAKLAWRQAAQVWGKSLQERGELDKQRNVMLSARLEVGVETEGSVDLTFGTQRLVLRKAYARGQFSIDREGRAVFTGPDGKAFPAA